jgi:hypothetical protein
MSALVITEQAVARLLADVRLHGARRVEAGAFLLAREIAPERLELVALAGERGIRRARDLFKVPGRAIERLFTWASDRDLMIRAQVHSHRRTAFLSPTDLRGGFSVDGFVTCVIPYYAEPPAEPEGWGWWEYGAGRWRTRTAPTPVAGEAEVVYFDTGGVHGA